MTDISTSDTENFANIVRQTKERRKIVTSGFIEDRQ